MEHDAGVERIIEAFESGWKAGSAFGAVASDGFGSVSSNLQEFWLDGFYAAQAWTGADESLDGSSGVDGSLRDHASELHWKKHRLSHAVGRSLQKAYTADGNALFENSLASLLAQL